MTFLNVYKGFLQSGKSSQWCYKNYVNYQAMVCISIAVLINWRVPFHYILALIIKFVVQKKVIEIREQLKRTAQRLGIVLKSCETDMLVNIFTHFCSLIQVEDVNTVTSKR